MTRPRSLLAVVGTTALVLSCSRAPTAPGMSPVSQAPGTQSAAASQEWTRGSVHVDSTVPCACLGEDVHFLGDYAFRSHLVVSGAGTYHTYWQALPVTPTAAPLLARGVNSGKVFVRVASPAIQTSEAGYRIQVLTLVDHETYVADDGARLLVTERLHTVSDGNGHLILEKMEPWSIECSK